MFFGQEEYEERWRKVYAEMKKRGFDTAVVFGRSGGTHERCGNVLYLTNFYSSVSGHGLRGRTQAFSAVILTDGEVPELHVGEPDPPMDLLSTERVKWDMSDPKRGADPIRSVAMSLREKGIEGPVAMIGYDFLPILQFDRICEMVPAIEWKPNDELIETVRRVKSPKELEAYRRGGENCSAALTAMMHKLIEGATEAEAAGAAAKELLSRGGNYQYMPLSHGDRMKYFAGYPLNGYGETGAKEGEMVRGFLWGPMYQGYWLDPGRTAVCGNKPTPAQQDLIETAASAIDELMAAIRPGAKVIEVAQLGDELLAKSGGPQDQAAEMFPVYGHGIGLLWEEPMISTHWPTGLDQFEANMVLGVEFFAAREGVGSASFEQNVILTDSGPELIISTPMTF